jgi:hypothetical protein
VLVVDDHPTMTAGATGYLMKSARLEEVVTAEPRVLGGAGPVGKVGSIGSLADTGLPYGLSHARARMRPD